MAIQEAEPTHSRAIQNIARFESGLRHFDAPPGESGSDPLWSRDKLGGLGILQNTDPAPTEDMAWNWRLGVAAGVQLFRQKLAVARRYPAAVRSSAAFRQLVSELAIRRAAEKKGEALITLPDFNQDQLERDAVRGFNGYAGRDRFGLHLHEYRVVLGRDGLPTADVNEATRTGTFKWERVPAEDRPNVGDPDYVRHVYGEAA